MCACHAFFHASCIMIDKVHSCRRFQINLKSSANVHMRGIFNIGGQGTAQLSHISETVKLPTRPSPFRAILCATTTSLSNHSLAVGFCRVSLRAECFGHDAWALSHAILLPALGR